MEFGRVLVLTLAVSALCTLVSRPLAFRLGIADAPGTLKIHKVQVARFGGLGIYAALLVGVSFLPAQNHQLLVGATVMWIVGVIDDRWTISSYQKLTGQLVAGSVLWYLISASNPGPIGLMYGFLGFFLAVVFSNAVNLIDGMDGLAGGNAFLIFAGFGALQLLHAGDPALPLVIGACILGFLPFNFPRAWLFMGDSGSLLLGYLMAYILIQLLVVNPVLFIGGLTIGLLPLFDLTLGVIRRAIARKPIFAADRCHFYDRLNDAINNKVTTVCITFVSTVVLTGIGIALSFHGLAFAASGLAIVVVAMFVIASRLGCLRTASPGGIDTF